MDFRTIQYIEGTKMKKENGIIESLIDIHRHISKWKKESLDRSGLKNAYLKLDFCLLYCILMLVQDLNFNYDGTEAANVMGPLFAFDVVAEIWTGFYYQHAIIQKNKSNNISNSMKSWILINTFIRMGLISTTIILLICTYIKMKFRLRPVLIFSIITGLIGDALQICFLMKICRKSQQEC